MPLRLSPEDIKQLGLKGIRVKAGQSKYRAVRTEYNGVSYASKAEARRAKQLDELKPIKIVDWWLAQPKFRLGCPENVYVADFLVVMRLSGLGPRIHVEDVKGIKTAKFNRDVKLWAKYGPCQLWIIRRDRTDIIEGGRQ